MERDRVDYVEVGTPDIGPTGVVSPDGWRLYLLSGQELLIVDLMAKRERHRLKLGYHAGITMGPDINWLYLVEPISNTLTVLNTYVEVVTARIRLVP